MSDYYVYIIPEQPDLVLEEGKRENAVAYFRSIAPEATITSVAWDITQFIDCGANFERVLCPSCGTEIELGQWQQWMGQDWHGEAKGFVLVKRALPCCGSRHSLHELNYEWPQGFARSVVCAENPKIGQLSETQHRRFEQILGCAVRVVYRHI